MGEEREREKVEKGARGWRGGCSVARKKTTGRKGTGSRGAPPDREGRDVGEESEGKKGGRGWMENDHRARVSGLVWKG